MDQEKSPSHLRQFFDAREEWLAIDALGRSLAVRRGEIEISENGGKIFLEFPGEKGFVLWRVAAWQIIAPKIILDLKGRFGKEKTRISFVPRVSAAELGAAVELARMERAGRIAALIVSSEPGATLVRVNLNKENSRFAEIFFADRANRQAAVLADVSESVVPEMLLTRAILRLEKLRRRKINPIQEICVAAEEKTAKKLQKLCALLNGIWRSGVKVLSIQRDSIERLPEMSFDEAFKRPPRAAAAAADAETSAPARRALSLSPPEIDVIFSRGGETVRFKGLPFMRVRRTAGTVSAWFGVENERRMLTDENFSELAALIEDLKVYRRGGSPNPRHEFYRAAPEAWLESMLRRDIRRLDANLILSPVHVQFRVSGEKIDLLAARRDGRLVVIEIKASSDREAVFQAAGYWREIEAHRRAGAFEKNRIFGEIEIQDAPPLVYLVAPGLSFHPDSAFFARTLDEKIEIFRFDLNESWRESIKVLSRRSLTENL